jgi:hypothetical protein
MTTQAKFQATLNYISTNVSSALTSDLMMRIASAASLEGHDKVMDEMMAGISTQGAGVFVTNGDARRHALRALLLCQQVYLPTPGWDYRQQIAGWPKPTIDFWASKSEANMIKGIRMYMPLPNADADTLVSAASRLGPTTIKADRLSERLHTVTREDRNFPIESTCYRAVQSWLLASGHVSLRWFLTSSVAGVAGEATDDNCVAAQLLALFGAGTMTDVTDNPAIADQKLVRGDVVYMYRSNQNGKPKAGGQLGHWMVCEGNGFGWGCNNFSEHEARGTNTGYDRANIVNQIRAMQHDRIRPNEKDWHFIRVFKPNQFEKFPI